MNVGDMRHRIIIQQNVAQSQNETGFPDEDWQVLMILYAKRTGLKGRLFYQAAAAQAESDVMFKIRYAEGIKAGMRIIDGTETFEIKLPPIDPDGKRMWLEIHSRQVLINGG